MLHNAGFLKTVRLERVGQVQLGVAFVNVLNRVTLDEPALNISSSTAGHHLDPRTPSRTYPANGLLSLPWSF